MAKTNLKAVVIGASTARYDARMLRAALVLPGFPYTLELYSCENELGTAG
jgi:hypothetical protein